MTDVNKYSDTLEIFIKEVQRIDTDISEARCGEEDYREAYLNMSNVAEQLINHAKQLEDIEKDWDINGTSNDERDVHIEKDQKLIDELRLENERLKKEVKDLEESNDLLTDMAFKASNKMNLSSLKKNMMPKYLQEKLRFYDGKANISLIDFVMSEQDETALEVTVGQLRAFYSKYYTTKKSPECQVQLCDKPHLENSRFCQVHEIEFNQMRKESKE